MFNLFSKRPSDPRLRNSFDQILNDAEAGNTEAQVGLAEIYAIGAGVEQNLREAEKWYRRAAEAGHPEAQLALGNLCAGAPQERRAHSDAVIWYRRAADQGLKEAQYNLALMYQTGRGVALDLAESAKWYRHAAEQGYADAQACLGHLYMTGKGVEKNIAEALKWTTHAAIAGSRAGQTNVAALLYGLCKDDPNKGGLLIEALMWACIASEGPSVEDEDYVKIRKLREAIAERLSPEQILEAEKRAHRRKSMPTAKSG